VKKRDIVGTLKAEYPVSLLCQVLDMERSTYYYQATEDDDLSLLVLIEAVIRQFPTYGYRRITAQLRREGLDEVNHKRVLRVMRENDLIRRKKRVQTTTQSNHTYGRYPNLVLNLNIDHPDQVWCADITYIHLGTHYVYLAILMDVFTRSLRGWHLSRTLSSELVMTALNHALRQHRPEIHHSDQGVQYAATGYVEHLRELGIKPSMSAKGQPTQNAFAERVIRTIKEEEVYLNEYTDFAMAYREIGHFIDDVYQYKRIHSALGYLTPSEFESAYQMISAA
jgi:transposase InsO family protein